MKQITVETHPLWNIITAKFIPFIFLVVTYTKLIPIAPTAVIMTPRVKSASTYVSLVELALITTIPE